MDIGELLDAVENPSNVKFTAVEDLKAYGLELLSSFESPPCATAFGSLDVIPALRKALPFWQMPVLKAAIPRWKAGTF